MNEEKNVGTLVYQANKQQWKSIGNNQIPIHLSDLWQQFIHDDDIFLSISTFIVLFVV